MGDQLSAAAGVKTLVKEKGKRKSNASEDDSKNTERDVELGSSRPKVEEEVVAVEMVQPRITKRYSTKSSKHQGYFHHFLFNPHPPHNPHTRPGKKKIFICGFGLTEKHLY